MRGPPVSPAYRQHAASGDRYDGNYQTHGHKPQSGIRIGKGNRNLCQSMIVKGNHGFKPPGLHYHANRRFPFPSCIIQKQLLFSNNFPKVPLSTSACSNRWQYPLLPVRYRCYNLRHKGFCSILNKSAPTSSEITFATFSVLPTVT